MIQRWICHLRNKKNQFEIVKDHKQGKSEGFDSCDRPSNLTQIGFQSSIFSSCDLEIWWMTPKNNRALILCYFKLSSSFRSHRWIQTGVTVWKCLIWVKIDDFLAVWPWNLTDDLKKHKRAHLLCYFKLCAAFRSHWWIQTGVTVRKLPIWVKIDDF